MKSEINVKIPYIIHFRVLLLNYLKSYAIKKTTFNDFDIYSINRFNAYN